MLWPNFERITAYSEVNPTGAAQFPDYFRVEDYSTRAALKLLFMAGITPFTYGDVVRVIKGEYKGSKGAIVGMNDTDSPSVFTIEFGNGSDAEVPLESLEKIETDIILPPNKVE